MMHPMRRDRVFSEEVHMTNGSGQWPLSDCDYHSLVASGSLFFIAGPCVIESEAMTLEIAHEIARIRDRGAALIIFKASFDKANRTSIDSYRGPGLEEGLKILAGVRDKTGMPVMSDIHTPDQAEVAGKVLDVIQIPAFLSRQTDLLVAAGRTNRWINIKKGQFQSPEDIQYAINKVRSTGNAKILLTERGVTFGYRDLVADMRSIVRMKRYGVPVVFDATHSAQFPGASDGCSAGDRSLVPPLARAAVAAGADGVFMEVHPEPEKALCDGPNSLRLCDLDFMIQNLCAIHALVPPSLPSDSYAPHACAAPSIGDSKLDEALKRIRLIIFDVDGILTDGSIIFAGSSLEIKSFHVRDGHGIKIAKRCGLQVALVTGRYSDVVERRARDLGIDLVHQGIWDKRPVLDELMNKLSLAPEEVAVLGDDVVDIPIMRRVGLSVTVPEAPLEVKESADYITKLPGGKGAAREVVEMILKGQGKWKDAMARYYD